METLIKSVPHHPTFYLGPPFANVTAVSCRQMVNKPSMLQRAQASFRQAEAQWAGLILHCQWLIKNHIKFI